MVFCKNVLLEFLLIMVFLLDIVVIVAPSGLRSDDILSSVGSHEDSQNGLQKASPKLSTQIIIHGFLLWFSMAFLMPIGVLVIRMSDRVKSGNMLKCLFYSHAILQIVAVVIATVAAILALKIFENNFKTTHQRLGVALYVLVWIQPLVAIFRPNKGDRRRRIWYFGHWFIGTVASIVAITDVYLGLHMYHIKTSKNAKIWTILFSIQVAIFGFIYLIQDRWDHMRNQGIKPANEQINPADGLPLSPSTSTRNKSESVSC